MTLSSQTVIPTRGAVVRARFNPTSVPACC